jgi:hypothetical protein
MEMNNFGLLLQDQPDHIHRTRWIVDSLAFHFSIVSQIDHFTPGFTPKKEILERG